MLVQKTQNYAIELKEEFVPKKGKVYSLSREEREKVQAFIEDQLRKGYIRPSKLPQTSPVHFIAKKNGAGLSTYKSVDNKEWVSFTPHHRYTGWSRKEEGVHKAGPKVGIQ